MPDKAVIKPDDLDAQRRTYAAAALSGLAARIQTHGMELEVAKHAFALADAMLKQQHPDVEPR